jgi:uncharacterized protein involved in outer membrane biogenesis
MIKILKFTGITISVLAGLLILAVVAVNLIPGEKYKALIISGVRSATGRDLAIEGDLDIKLFTSLGFKASGIKFSNADWGSRSHMASVGNIEAEVALFPLLAGVLDVTLVVEGPDLLLETHGSGQGNWKFTELVEEAAEKSSEAVKTVQEIEQFAEETQSVRGLPLRVRIRKVHIKGTRITFIDGKSGDQTIFEKDKLIIEPVEDRLTIELAGKFNDIPLALTGGFDNAEFFAGNQPAQVSFDGHFGEANLMVRGTAGPLAPTFDLDVSINLNTNSVTAFSPLVGRGLPDIGPLAVSVKLTGKEGKYAASDMLTTLEDETITAQAKGSIADLVTLNGLKLEASVSTDQLTGILKTAGFQSESALPDLLHAAIVAEGSLENLAVKQFQTTVQGRGLSIDGSAQVKNVMTLEGVTADISLEADSLDLIEKITKTKLPPFATLKATANITSTGENLGLMEIKANLNGDIIHADITGSMGDPMKLKDVNADVKLKLDSLAWLEDYLKIELPPLGALNAHANIVSKDETLDIKDIKADLAGENISARVTGSVGDLLKARGIAAKVDLDVRSLDFVSDYVKIDLPPLGSLKATANIASKGATFEIKDINANLSGENITAKVTGAVGDLLKAREIDTIVDLGVQSLAFLSNYIKMELPPLGPLKASASIASKGDTFVAKEIEAELAGEKIQARVAASMQDILKLTGFDADIDLAVDSLASLGTLVKQKLPDSGPVTLEGKISGKGVLGGATAITGVVKSDGFMANLSGSVGDPLAARGIDLAINLEADSMRKVGKLTGTQFQGQKPIKLDGNFSAGDNAYELSAMHLRIGEVAVKGKAALKLPPEADGRPRVSGELHIGELDFSKEQAETDTAMETAFSLENEIEAEVGNKEKVFPSDPLPFGPLKIVDADISVTVESLTTLQIELENVVATLTLDNGLLKLKPMKARVGNGTFEGTATLDTGTTPAALSTDVELKDATFRDFGGKINLLADLDGSGDSIAAIMAGLDGKFMFDARDATLKKSFMTGFGSGLLDSLNPFRKNKETTELTCAIIVFDIEDGIADANRKIAAQMTDVTWFGSGEINLKTEQIDFGMNPKPRKGLGISLGELAKLVHVGGTLAKPKTRLDPKDLAVKYGKYSAAVATGGLTLVADLLFSRIRANSDVCSGILEGLEPKEPSQGK